MAPDCGSVGFASPETTGRTRSRSGIASRQCSPVADGRLHSPETPLCCCLARAQAFFLASVDALESQVQFCWQEAHGERHEASGRGARPDRSPRMRAPTRAAARAAQRRTTLMRSRRRRRRRRRTRSARRVARQAGRRTRASTRGTRQRPWRTSWRYAEACTRGLMVCRRDWFRTD